LLSIVPVFAMAFGIAKGFGLENAIEKQVMTQLKGQEEVARWIISFAHSFLQNTQGGLVAGIGVIVLFWTIIKVLNNIEDSFNAIWKANRRRTVIRKVADYLAIMLIAPIFMIIASSINVFIAREVHSAIGRFSILYHLGPFLIFGLKLAPYIVTWIIFSFIYIVMPNHKVHLLSALAGGLISGTIYQAFQYLYIYFQIGVSQYNAIYGSFAALPLFLVWLQTSWLILLYGSEIAFAFQNAERHEFEPDCSKLSHSMRRVMGLAIASRVAKDFDQGKGCCTEERIFQSLDIPIIMVQELVQELVDAGVLSETKSHTCVNASFDNSEVVYQPAFDIGKMTLGRVIRMWEEQGINDVEFGKSEQVERISGRMRDLQTILESAEENTLLKDV
jgi:membrane protein